MSQNKSNSQQYKFRIKPLSDSSFRYKNKSKGSYKDIQITDHAMIRSIERLGITRKDELKKLSNTAKYKGVNISLIRRDNYDKFGLSFDEYKYIKGRFSKMNNSTTIYIYQGNLFIFCGKGTKTLKTVINLELLVKS